MRLVGLLEVLVLSYLSEQPMCGKDLVDKIKKKTSGAWKVSYGSIYPLLNKLEKSKNLEVSKQDKKKIYGVTVQGREYYLNSREQLMQEMVDSVLDQFPLILELLPQGDKWGSTVSRLIAARKKLYSLIQAFPDNQRSDAKLKILSDIADLLDYYTQGVKNG
jgi:DNA-binding PadR family transcriptional regulator